MEAARMKDKRPNNMTIGKIEKKSKFTRLLNGRFLIDKKDTIGEGHHGKVMKGISPPVCNSYLFVCFFLF